MWPSVGALLAFLWASTVAAWEVDIGYLSSVMLTPPLGIAQNPGIKCGLIANLWDADEGNNIYWNPADNKYQADNCPSAGLSLFCSRWGCPHTFNWNADGRTLFTVTVISENRIDRSITVEGADVHGNLQRIKCPWVWGSSNDRVSGNFMANWEWNCRFLV
jgi:hypothetical protein